MIVDAVINEYWAYDNEPFTILRIFYEGKGYLIGLETPESLGVDVRRRQSGYFKPDEEIVTQALELLESENISR